MNNINYQKQIDSIKNQMPEYKQTLSNTKNFDMVTNTNNNTNQNCFNKFTFKIWYIYIAIPIILMLVLFIWKPKYIKNSYIDDDGNEKYKINWNKYFMWILILSALIIIPLFGYNYKYKGKNVNTDNITSSN